MYINNLPGVYVKCTKKNEEEEKRMKHKKQRKNKPVAIHVEVHRLPPSLHLQHAPVIHWTPNPPL